LPPRAELAAAGPWSRKTRSPVLSKALTPTSETLAGEASKQAGLLLILVGFFF
jgi:hypothetical protein